MASRRLDRQLSKVGDRVRALRDELGTIDAQLAQLGDDADDLATQALVADSPAVGHEAVDASRHVAAMRRHRQHVLDEIARLEARQDELLDRYNT